MGASTSTGRGDAVLTRHHLSASARVLARRKKPERFGPVKWVSSVTGRLRTAVHFYGNAVSQPEEHVTPIYSSGFGVATG
jgi:hypothetical protein